MQDLVVRQEKITVEIYTRELTGYRVVASDAPIRHRGGVALFYQDFSHFAVEAYQKQGTNAVSFQMATG